MAYYDSSQLEDEKDPNAEGGSAVATGPQSSVITGTQASGTAGTAKTNAPDNPGNFVGIKQYLDANKPQAQKLGDQTAGIINQSADEARQGVSALNQEATEKIKGVDKLDTPLASRLQHTPETLNQDERNKIKSTASATYKGPQSFTDLTGYLDAQKKSQTATQNIEKSGTEEGRMGLISQINSKPRTQGMNVFDNALLQAGGGREKLSQAAQANQDVKGSLDQTTQNIQGQIGRVDDPSTPDIDESSGAMGNTAKAQADAYKRIQDSLSGFNQNLQSKLDATRASELANYNNARQDITDDTLSASTLASLGIDPGRRLYDANLQSYFNEYDPAGFINRENVASQEDYAREAALADLAGIDPTLSDSSQAGTYKNQLNTFNKTGLQEYLAGKDAEFGNVLSQAPTMKQNIINLMTNLRGQGRVYDSVNQNIQGPDDLRAALTEIMRHNSANDRGAVMQQIMSNPTQYLSPGMSGSWNQEMAKVVDYLNKHDSYKPTRTANKG